ncbi:PD40 domain-containing protein [Paenibacillus sp. IB182496]|uniref:PD40 domain-containing protein n=1 Tax=Paenibacillus sabuli TaxID=2772509 RepID=A0A927BRX5_9BACL|nr:LpqB family beta-propeller domain-containing protein [Paenibacillus sabuli]MBD2845652.1 PD40 domain-containing protein [Paenibacillus sabuli]
MKNQRNHQPTKRTALALMAACLLAAGCGQSNANEGREVIEKPDKEITVLENGAQAQDSAAQVQTIDELEALRGFDWLNEEEIIVSQPNEEAEPITVEGEARYPNHLYAYNLTTDELEPLQESDEEQNFALLSPDRKHLFYKVMEEASGFPHMLDLESGESIRLMEDQLFAYEGDWADNTHVVFGTVTGQIVSADVEGNVEVLAEAGGVVSDVHRIDDRLYYQNGGVLYMLELADDGTAGEARELMEGVDWVVPSPDGQQLAIVRQSGEAERTLMLTDLEGNEKTSLATSTQIFGTSWAPDGTRLVYNAVSESGGDKGVFIADAVTGQTTQIAVDMEYAADKIRWSPSGARLLTAQSVETDEGYTFKTYVITLQ